MCKDLSLPSLCDAWHFCDLSRGGFDAAGSDSDLFSFPGLDALRAFVGLGESEVLCMISVRSLLSLSVLADCLATLLASRNNFRRCVLALGPC